MSVLLGVLGSAKTGLKRVRGRQPRLERHVGVAWLCCYAAYKLSCAQLILTSKPEHCCLGTLPFSFLAESVQSTRLSLQPSELAPPPRYLTCKRVLPPFGSRGDTLAGGRGGGGDPSRTKGQTLWYSRYSIIPLRFLVSHIWDKLECWTKAKHKFWHLKQKS